MSASEKTILTTLEDYESLPEDVRAEVFEGEISYMASPSSIHQELLLEISVLIRNYIKKKSGKCKVYPAPYDIKLSNNPLIIVQPDISVICDLEKIDKNRCNGAPDWVIEIISPSNSSNDFIRKAYYYQTFGVREYWIVDPIQQKIFVNFFEKNLCNQVYTFHDQIKVNIYDDLFIDFSQWEELLSSS